MGTIYGAYCYSEWHRAAYPTFCDPARIERISVASFTMTGGLLVRRDRTEALQLVLDLRLFDIAMGETHRRKLGCDENRDKDNIYMMEALNKGIRARDLRIQNKTYNYMVFRANNPRLAQGAADCSNMMLKVHYAQKSMPYTITGAVGSIFGKDTGPKTAGEFDKVLDQILAGSEHPFFCSQFVVYVYQFVAEQNGFRGGFICNMSDPKVSPARLMTFLSSSANFKFVGELPANVR